jgi:hypothetical protein
MRLFISCEEGIRRFYQILGEVREDSRESVEECGIWMRSEEGRVLRLYLIHAWSWVLLLAVLKVREESSIVYIYTLYIYIWMYIYTSLSISGYIYTYGYVCIDVYIYQWNA